VTNRRVVVTATVVGRPAARWRCSARISPGIAAAAGAPPRPTDVFFPRAPVDRRTSFGLRVGRVRLSFRRRHRLAQRLIEWMYFYFYFLFLDISDIPFAI